MNHGTFFKRMARYNAWMNGQVHAAASALPIAALAQDRGAFFGSILGTLNHLVVADTLWFKRLAEHPAGWRSLDPFRALPQPTALNQTLFDQLAPWQERRTLLDNAIIAWADEVNQAQWAGPFSYRNMAGQTHTRPLAAVMQHVFNHQTHHRGQVSALLTQAGPDVGVTDLISMPGFDEL